MKPPAPVVAIILCISCFCDAPSAVAQTSFTEELLPNPLAGMQNADVYSGASGGVHVLSTLSSTTSLFDNLSGIRLQYHLIRDSSGNESYTVVPDTGTYYSSGFFGRGENFSRSGALDGQDNLFFCWTKQHWTFTDVGPFFYHLSAPILQCIKQTGSTRDSLFELARATTPAVAIGPDNIAHIAWGSITSVRGDSNYQAYTSVLMYRSCPSAGSLSPIQIVDSGFVPILLSNAPSRAHLVWLRGDSSTAPVFQIMYRSINAGTISDAVVLKRDTYGPNKFTCAVDSSGVIHLLWSEPRPEGLKVFFLRYDGAAVTIDSSAGMSNASTLSFAVSPEGIIHIAWVEYDGTREKLYYTNSRTSAPFASVRVFSSADISFVDVLCLFLRSTGTAGAVISYSGTMHFIGDLESGADTTIALAVGNIAWNATHPVAVDAQNNVWVVYGKSQPGLNDPLLCLGRFTEKPLAAEMSPRRPQSWVLYQNYPNPFNPSTTIRYDIPQALHVSVAVFNALGQQVALLVDEVEQPGNHQVRFDGSAIASGVYFCRMVAGSFVRTRKLLVLH